MAWYFQPWIVSCIFNYADNFSDLLVQSTEVPRFFSFSLSPSFQRESLLFHGRVLEKRKERQCQKKKELKKKSDGKLVKMAEGGPHSTRTGNLPFERAAVKRTRAPTLQFTYIKL